MALGCFFKKTLIDVVILVLDHLAGETYEYDWWWLVHSSTKKRVTEATDFFKVYTFHICSLHNNSI